MRTLTYETYLDKVYGCFVGKAISGNMGAPHEGQKMPMELPFMPEMVNPDMPNDDLDLQVLWLDVVEKKGADFTSRDLLARWERDVVNLRPQWVSICIGINDVWRQFDCPAMPDYAVTPEQYEENVEKMVVSAKSFAKGVILMTPYMIEPLKEDKMRARMDVYGDICRKLAEKHDAIFVDLQAMFDRYFEHRHSAFIAWDQIHPNQIGATLIAREFLRACGFDYLR